MRNHIILDTDIGTDIDDALALALCLASPELELMGVTTVYVNTLLRSKIALKLMELSGASNIPVHAGENDPLRPGLRPHWLGHEGKGVFTYSAKEGKALSNIRQDAASFIEQHSKRSANITLVAIGPLTNLAQVLKFEFFHPREILFMGGIYNHTLYPGLVDHNINCDIGAACSVIESGHPFRFVTYDITMQTQFNRQDIRRVESCQTPFTTLLAKLMTIWLDKIQRDYSPLHDPLTVSTLLDNSFIEFKPARVSILPSGHTKFELVSKNNMQNTNIHVSTSINNGFKEWFFNRICSFPWPKKV